MKAVMQSASIGDYLREGRAYTREAVKTVSLPARIAFCALLILDIPALFKTSSLTHGFNSDNMTPFLAATDILHGNILLHGWHLASDNFYLSDFPFFVLTQLIFGKSVLSIYAATFLIYLVVLAAAIGIVIRMTTGSKGRWLALAAIMFYLGTPMLYGSARWLFMGSQHIAALGFCLLSWISLESALRAERWRSTTILACLYAISAFVPLLSDPFTIILFLVPTLAALATELLFPRPEVAKRRRTVTGLLFFLTILSFTLARFGIVLIHDFHGFITSDPTFDGRAFVDAAGLGKNAAGIFFGLTSLFGGYIFGHGISIGSKYNIFTIGVVVRLLGLGFVLVSVFIALRRWLRNAEGWDLRFVLALAIAIDLAGCLVSRYFYLFAVPGELTRWDAAIRFLSPVLVFGAVLAALELGPLIDGIIGRKQRAIVGTVLASGFFSVVFLYALEVLAVWHMKPAMQTSRARTVGQWLASHGLTHGVGGYWDSKMITALSGEKVIVASVSGVTGKLVPFFWLANRNTYKKVLPPQFVVYSVPDTGYPVVPLGAHCCGITPEVIAATYKQPIKIKHINGYNIAIIQAR